MFPCRTIKHVKNLKFTFQNFQFFFCMSVMYRHDTILPNLTHFGISIFIFTGSETESDWQNLNPLRVQCLSSDDWYAIMGNWCDDNSQKIIPAEKPAPLDYCPEKKRIRPALGANPGLHDDKISKEVTQGRKRFSTNSNNGDFLHQAINIAVKLHDPALR